MNKEMPDIISLAHKLAVYHKQGLVKSVAGIPNFEILADKDAIVDKRVFERDLEARTKTYQNVLRCLDDGVAWLTKNNATVEKALAMIDEHVKKGDRLFYAWGEWIVFSESTVPQTFEKTLPEPMRNESVRAKAQRERIAVSYVDVVSLGRIHDGYTHAVPLQSERFRNAWTSMLAAEKEGIFYIHKNRYRNAAKDENIISASAKDFVAEHCEDPRFLVDKNTMERFEQLVREIPGMRARKRVRAQIEAGRKWWQVAEEFASALAHRKEIAQYWRVINICGAGRIKGDTSKYFVHEPDFSAEPHRGTENAFRIRHALEHGTPYAFREVFCGNGWSLPFRDRNREFDDYAQQGLISREEAEFLKRDWRAFIDLANKTFREYFTAYQS